MASESVQVPAGATDLGWLPNFRNEPPRIVADRKLHQAEMLAHCLYGEGGDGFRAMNHVIQDGVLWLLASLLTEAREAMDAAGRRGGEG